MIFKTRLLVMAASVGMLAACALEPDPSLALVCQTKECLCVPVNASFLDKTDAADLLWHSNGDAYCPKDFVLRRADEE